MNMRIWSLLALVATTYLISILVSCTTVAVVPAPALDWDNPGWTRYLNEQVDIRFADFNKARDINLYCPNYKKLDHSHQVLVWSTLAVAIAKFESNYKPTTVYQESTGQDSIGLFQMSYGDGHSCPPNKAAGLLTDPLVNIKCAVSAMADFVGKDGVVASGGYIKYGAPPPYGMARYWSVLRVPDKKSKHHLAAIKNLTSLSDGCK